MKQDTRKTFSPPYANDFCLSSPCQRFMVSAAFALLAYGGRREGNFPEAMRHITCKASSEHGGTMGAISIQRERDRASAV